MPMWSELQTEFRALSGELRGYRLDYQWGAAGTYYRIAGGVPSNATRRFEELSAIAGARLSELPNGVAGDVTLRANSARERWYEAVKSDSGAFEFGFVAWQSDEAGNHQGDIYTGQVHGIADASALLALRYSALASVSPPVRDAGVHWTTTIEEWLAGENASRGRLWALLGFVVMLVLGIVTWWF